MEHTSTVKVYSFQYFDVDAKLWRISNYKATRGAIVSHLGGEPLEGTEHEIDPAELDGQGRYRRIATGWGELG